ncbi:IS630 family transposase [Endozoicomonas sp. SCSIO W0465]|uniref:IS630 family transposase n=1 Tax=Endozoicomonas sp. SCSIO W0465 TaxID=2918516 RepID=UPI0035324F4E
MNVRYPAILQQAEEQDAIIFFLDESTAKSECHRGRTWGIKGLTPVVKTTGSRHRLNLISVVSSEGCLRYKTFTGKMDRFMFVKYLKSLVRSVDKPVIIITDGHPAHRAKYTKDYVEQEPKLLGLHLLPSYSPELNPDEQVWNHLKEKLGKTALKTKADFIDFIRSKMRALQKMPEAVKGFFRLHNTGYACRQCYLVLVQKRIRQS